MPVARYLPIDPVFVADRTLVGPQVVLATGLDFTGLAATQRPASDFAAFLATTTTTAPGAAPSATTPTSAASMVPSTPPGQLCG